MGKEEKRGKYLQVGELGDGVPLENKELSVGSWDFKCSLIYSPGGNLQGRYSPLVVSQPVREWLGSSCVTHLKV